MNKCWFLITGLIFTLLIGCADYDEMDSPKPAPVELTLIGATDSTVTLRWTRSTARDFKCYKLFRATNDIVEPSDTLVDSMQLSQDTVKVVRGLADSTHHYFRVFVYTTSDSFSGSNTVDTTLISRAEGAITLFRSDPIIEGPVNLRWTKRDSVAVVRYLVYADTQPDVDTTDTLVAVVRGDTTASITRLKPDHQYWFRIYGDKGFGPLLTSNTVSVTISSGMPSALVLDVIGKNDTSVTLGWNESPDTDFSYYAVFYDTTAQLDSLRRIDLLDKRIIKLTVQTDTMLMLGGLTGGRRYLFCVYNVDKKGSFVRSNIDSASLPATYPTAAVLSMSSASDSTVSLRWTANTDSMFHSYRLYMDTTAQIDTAKPPLFESTSAAKTDTTIHSLSRLRQYWFVISTQSSNRLKTWSNTVVNYPFILFRGTATDSTVRLEWKQSTNLKFMAYKVFRDTASSVSNISESLTDVGLIGRLFTTFTDTTVDSAKTYSYRVYEYDSTGVARGSNILKVVTP